MRLKPWIYLLLAAALAAPVAAFAQQNPQQDFLTQNEADQIRDAGTTNERIGLFLDFAADRLQRFEHELQVKGTGPLRGDFLNDLLDSFTSCVDAASSRVDDGMTNGEDVRAGIRDIRKRVPKFLAELNTIKAKGTDLKVYQDSLDDSASDLRDDLSDAEKAQKRIEFNSPSTKRHGPESD